MENDMITAGSASFAMPEDPELAKQLVSELGGMNISYDRIKVPSGGITLFEIPGENPGETETVKEFSGGILYHHPMNTYYRNSYDGSVNPPDCSSYDGINGIGNPGGLCISCPYNAFGSDGNKGKACKNKHRLYVLREGELIPVILTIPCGSVTEFNVFAKRLLSKMKLLSSVVTKFSLEKAKNQSGMVYTKCCFSAVRTLNDDELPFIKSMIQPVKAYAEKYGHDDDNDASDGVTAAPVEVQDSGDLPF